jgi:hypothetical protein
VTETLGNSFFDLCYGFSNRLAEGPRPVPLRDADEDCGLCQRHQPAPRPGPRPPAPAPAPVAGREVVAATPTPSVPKALPRRSPKNTLPSARSLSHMQPQNNRAFCHFPCLVLNSIPNRAWLAQPPRHPSSPRVRIPYTYGPLKTTMLNRKKPEEKPRIPLKSASHKLYYVNYKIGPTQPAPGSSVFEPEGPRFPLLRLISSQRVSPILAVRVRS